MNRGIELLIARMKSNPEEFAPDSYMREGSSSKWEQLVSNWRHCLTEEEIHAFQSALKEVHRELFSQRVMKHLLTADEVHEVEEAVPMRYHHPYNNSNITLASPHTTAGVINVGKETIDEQMLAQMKEMIKANKERRAK